MADTRERKTERRRGVVTGAGHRKAYETPEDRSRWNRAYRRSRYGITQKQFDWLLEVQDYGCGMCHEPFTEDSVLCVDHDHNCCEAEKRSVALPGLRAVLHLVGFLSLGG